MSAYSRGEYGSGVTLGPVAGRPFLSPVGMLCWPFCSGCDKPSPGRGLFAVPGQGLRKARCVQSSKEAPLVQRGVAACAAGGIEGT